MANTLNAITANLVALGLWLGAHANKIASVIRQGLLVLVAFQWVVMDEAQLAIVAMFIEGALSLFVEGQTVSTKRVGERIDSEVAKIMGTGDGGPGPV